MASSRDPFSPITLRRKPTSSLTSATSPSRSSPFRSNPFRSSAWFRALTLEERAIGADFESPELQSDAQRAERRLDRYRRETGLLDEALYRRRLDQLGVTQSTLQALFGESDASLAARGPRQGWLDHLESIYRPWLDRRSSWIPTLRSSKLPGLDLSDLPDRDFAALFLPLLIDAERRLADGLRHLAAVHSSADAADGPAWDPPALSASLFRPLPRDVVWMTGRTVVLELHAAALGGELGGESPEARFEEFMEHLGSPRGAVSFLESYPVLARAVVEHIELWLRFSLDLARHLMEDRRVIVDTFFAGHDPGTPSEVEAGLSDRHDRGRTVARITFAPEAEPGRPEHPPRKLIYKPRSLGLERAFVDLAQGVGVPAHVPQSLDRGDHAYMRFVTPAPCDRPQGVERFYRQQGRHLALLYAFEATDLHYENVIAEGETPQLLDLETLFQPLVREEASAGSTLPPAKPESHTVLRSDFLPRRIWPEAGSPGLDLSGLGAGAGQRTPMTRLVDAGTDRARYEAAWTEIPAGANRPRIGDEVPPLWPFEDAIDQGFREAYGQLLEHHEGLLADDGPLNRLKELEIRSLLRGTAVYTRLLHTSFHPDLMRDALDRDRLFDKLWLEAKQRPSLCRAIPAEREALQRGDVPRFTTLVGSDQVIDQGVQAEVHAGTHSGTHTGTHSAGRFFQSSGLDQVRRRLRRLSLEDLEKQSRLIRESIRAGRPQGTSPPPLPSHNLQIQEPAPRGALVAEALRLARKLEASMIVCGTDEADSPSTADLAWFHLALAGPGAWGLEPVGPDLYSGLPGIALFFAHAGDLAPEPETSKHLKRLARATLDTARRRIAHNPLALTKVGAFAGWGGWIYTLCRLGRLWRDPKLIAEAEAAVDLLGDRLPTDRDFDLTGGAAGAVLALLTLPEPHPATRLETLRACGEHLLAHAVEMPLDDDASSLAWPPPRGGGDIPLTGLAHGSTGFAWALTRLADVTGNERFRQAAERALAYERSTLDPETGLWRDVRLDRQASDGEHPHFFAWCHGAPGIALGRLVLLNDENDPRSPHRSELEIALKATEDQGFGGGHCLCHGDWGHIDLLLEAARRLDRPELGERAAIWAHRLLRQGQSTGWRSGISFDTELPGLMTGLAGIGLGLLRAAYPDRVPSVLALDLPSTCSSES